MPLRSVVAVPAGEPLEAALASPADAVLLTVADAGHDVRGLRQGALYALPRVREAGKRALVRVNHPRTRMLRDDLDAIAGPGLDGVLLAQAGEPQDVRDLAVLLREFEYTRGIEPGSVAAFPVIASARGLLRAPEIARAAPRVAGLVFDAAAYAADIGARPEERGERLAYARGAVVAAARAAGRQAFAAVNPLELLNMAQYGFSGAVLPGPLGAGMANAAFSPKAHELERAREQLAAYEAARAEGAWVARYGNGIVDADGARRARQLLE